MISRTAACIAQYLFQAFDIDHVTTTALHLGVCTRIAGDTRRGVRSNPLDRLIRVVIRTVLTDTHAHPDRDSRGALFDMRETPDALVAGDREKLKAKVQC
jgi:hypothetical protein